jgi:hypothetical protein
MLEEKGIIDLTIKESDGGVELPCEYCLYAEINGIKVAYDAMDGYNGYRNLDAFLDKIDFYFKRSFSATENSKLQNGQKIHPLGLFYRVNYKNSPLDAPRSFTRKVTDLLRRLSGRDYRFYPSFFEAKPNYDTSKHPTIFFTTRLWNPEGEHDEIIESEDVRNERITINEMRVGLIRELKGRYGNSFIGGVSRTSFSEKICPDLIVDDRLYRRDNYIRSLKKNYDICIGSAGLHQSIGGKIGEYVAASKCIVSENFTYLATPEFVEGKNYFSYNTVKQCLEKIEMLVASPNLILEIQKNNYIYYNQYLRPDMLILNTIKFALNNL